jgi:hypothetical protein
VLHDPASSLIQRDNFQPTVSQIKASCYIGGDHQDDGGGRISGDGNVADDGSDIGGDDVGGDDVGDDVGGDVGGDMKLVVMMMLVVEMMLVVMMFVI